MRTLPDRILCLVTDLERAGGEGNLLRIVDEAVRGGVNIVQVRAHELDDEALTKLASGVVESVNRRALVVVNGAPEVAVSAGADGVHLRESSKLQRGDAGSGLLIGKSVHSVESALQAQEDGADYVVLGTIFSSASHPGGQTGGTELVYAVSDRLHIPVVGIGGITTENAGDVIEAGAAGIAVIGAIIGSDDPSSAAGRLASAIGLTVKQ